MLKTCAKAATLPTETRLGYMKKYTATATTSVPKLMMIKSLMVCLRSKGSTSNSKNSLII